MSHSGRPQAVEGALVSAGPRYDRHDQPDGVLCPMSGAPFHGDDSPRCMCGQAFTVENGQDPGDYVPHTMHTHRPIDRRPLQAAVTCPAWEALAATSVLTDVWGHTSVLITLEGSQELQIGPTYAEAARLSRLLTQGLNPGEALEVEAWVMTQWRTHASSKAANEERAALQEDQVRQQRASSRPEVAPAADRGAVRQKPPTPGQLLDKVLGSHEVAHDVGPRFNCGEADTLAAAMLALGAREGAAVFLAGHAVDDDEGDLHAEWPQTDPLTDDTHPAWHYHPLPG